MSAADTTFSPTEPIRIDQSTDEIDDHIEMEMAREFDQEERKHTNMKQIHIRPAVGASDEMEEEENIAPPLEEYDANGSGRSRTPILYYFVMFASLLAISCAGTLLRKLEPTPPFLKAFWRLFFISWYLSIGFIIQYRQTSEEVKQKFWTKHTLLILFCTGVITSVHFATWIWSLQHTSLAHSLFFVCAHPLLIVMIMLLQGIHVNRWEWIGVLFGLLGSILMLLDDTIGSGANANETGSAAEGAENETSNSTGAVPVTWQGDVLAFIGACAMVAYLFSGKHCRSWLPLFLYAFPVTFIAAFPLLLMSMIMEEITWSGSGSNSVFGFLGTDAIGVMLLIVIGPGIIGHLGINFVQSHLPPLAISIVITVEPILGVVVGIIFGVEVTPHIYTLLGGPLTLIGCLLAVYGTWVREKDQPPNSPSNPPPTTSSSSAQSNSILSKLSNKIRHQPLTQFDEVELDDLDDWTDQNQLEFDLDQEEADMERVQPTIKYIQPKSITSINGRIHRSDAHHTQLVDSSVPEDDIEQQLVEMITNGHRTESER